MLLAIGCDTSTVEVDSAVVSKPYKYLSFDIEIPLLGRYQDLLRVAEGKGIEWRVEKQKLNISHGYTISCGPLTSFF